MELYESKELSEEENPYHLQISSKYKIDYDDLKEWKLLAETNFSTVFKGKLGEEEVAIKTLEIKFKGEDLLQEFEKEVDFMVSLHHPNILELKGCTLFPRISIVTKFMDGGALDGVLLKKGSTIPMSTKIKWATEICTGLLLIFFLFPFPHFFGNLTFCAQGTCTLLRSLPSSTGT